MHEDVARADRREDVRCGDEVVDLLRHELRIAQLREPGQRVHLKEAGHVDEAVAGVDVVRVQVECLQQIIADGRITAFLDLQANREAAAALAHLLLDALPHHPHGLSIHQQIWQLLPSLNLDPALVQRYVTLARDAVFYLDPHVCTRCRYRSTELLWQCPQCHEWNTFVEERTAPAKEAMAEIEARG